MALDFAEQSVEAEADVQSGFGSFEVDVGGLLPDGIVDHALDEANDRSFACEILEAFDLFVFVAGIGGRLRGSGNQRCALFQRLLDLRAGANHPGDRSLAGEREGFRCVFIEGVPAGDGDRGFVDGERDELVCAEKRIGDAQAAALRRLQRVVRVDQAETAERGHFGGKIELGEQPEFKQYARQLIGCFLLHATHALGRNLGQAMTLGQVIEEAVGQGGGRQGPHSQCAKSCELPHSIRWERYVTSAGGARWGWVPNESRSDRSIPW